MKTAATLPAEVRAQGLRAPEILTLAVTAGCNLQCGHCYVESPLQADAAPVPLSTLRRVLAEFSALGGAEVILTGGEPLTHPEWKEILQLACGEAALRRVRLQTNATLVTDAVAAFLRSLACEGFSIQVSLEGARAETHDRVRGHGSFRRSIEGLRRLTRAGLGGRITVAFTEMRHNVSELPELLDLLEGLGLRGVLSASLTQHGRASPGSPLVPPEPDQYRVLLRRYRSDAHFHEQCRAFAEVAALRWWEGRNYPVGSACSLLRNPYLSTDGRLYPCPLLHAEELGAAGALERPLAEVIRAALPGWVALQEASRRRGREIRMCGACPGRDHCGGGCMGRAHMAHGDLFAAEDRCELRRVVYEWKEGEPGT